MRKCHRGSIEISEAITYWYALEMRTAPVIAGMLLMVGCNHSSIRRVVGYWNFAVWSTKWQDSIGTDHKQWPDAKFLVVELYAENKDKTASVIPPIKLVDTQGREYDQSTKEVYVKDYFPPLKSLNPDVGTFGYLVFDVPADRKYALRLSGGMNSGAEALVDLP